MEKEFFVEPPDYMFNPNDIDISEKQISLYFLLQRLRENEIDLFAEYQRHWNLWSIVQQSRLIESLLIRIPIPSFYFDSRIDGKWQVVDGLQRVTTFNNFIIKESFKLTGLEFLPQFNEYKFSELPRELQRRIEEFPLTIYLINRGTPEDIKFIIFSRINTGGINLNNQELRYALNQGKATKFLVELAESIEFKDATFHSINPRRMQDYELINRFLAFYLFKNDYYGNLETFLNDTLYKLNHFEMDFSFLKSEFLKSMYYSKKIFEEYRFRKFDGKNKTKGRINKSLFDTVSVNIAWLSIADLDRLVEIRGQIINEMMNLLNDNEFIDSISFSTNSKRKVELRFHYIKELLIRQIE